MTELLNRRVLNRSFLARQLLLKRESLSVPQALEHLGRHPVPRPRHTPVPPRFLPEYDNALLSHLKRERIIASDYRNRIFTKGAVLVDGFAIGRWWLATKPKKVRDLMIECFERVSKRDMEAVIEEAARVHEFAAGDKAGKITLA